MRRKALACALLAAACISTVRAATVDDTSADSRHHLQLAEQYLHENKLNQAISEYQAVLTTDSHNLTALADLGVVYYFAGKYAEAIAQLQAALALQSAAPRLRSLLGMSEKRTGDLKKAQIDLQSALDSFSGSRGKDWKLLSQTGLELIEVDYALNDVGKAAVVVNGLREAKPDDPDILFTAHRIYSDLADETTLALALTAPESARMKQLIAHEQARRAETQSAIANYRAAIALDPKLPDLHFELADMLYESSSAADQAEAEKEYNAALRLNAFDEKSICRLAELAGKRSQTEVSLRYFERAYQLQPENLDANIGLAKTLMSMHKTLEALPHLERAVQLEPYDAIAHYRLSVAYRQLGRNEDARQELIQFEKLKKMKNNLQDLYQQMRIQPGARARLSDDSEQASVKP